MGKQGPDLRKRERFELEVSVLDVAIRFTMRRIVLALELKECTWRCVWYSNDIVNAGHAQVE